MTPSLQHSAVLLLQLPTPSANQLGNWLVSAAAALSLVALVKKFLPSRKTDLVSREEFHRELNSLRDKLDAQCLMLCQKIENLGTSLGEKLAELKSAVARIDERTK